MEHVRCLSGITVVLALAGVGCSVTTFGRVLEGGGLFGEERCVPLAVTPLRATPIQASAPESPCPATMALRARLADLLRRGYLDRALRLGEREMRRCQGVGVADLLNEARDALAELPTNPDVALREARLAEERGDSRAARRFYDAALRALEREGAPRVVPVFLPEFPPDSFQRQAKPEPVQMLRFSLDGGRLVYVGHNEYTAIFDLRGDAYPRFFPTVEPPYSSPWVLDVSPDGGRIAARTEERLAIYDTETGKITQRLSGEKDVAYEKLDAAAFLWDSRHVATGDEEGTLRVFRLADGAKRHEARAIRNHLQAIAPSPDGRFVATAFGSESAVRIRSLSKDEIYAILPTSADNLVHLAWSAGGRHLLAGGLRDPLHIWDLATCRARVLRDRPPCERHYGDESCTEAALFGVALSPDGSLVAGAFHFDGLFLWDGRTGARLAAVPLENEQGSYVTFSHDGSLLAVGTTVRALLFRVNQGGRPALEPLVRITMFPQGDAPVGHVLDVFGSPAGAPPMEARYFQSLSPTHTPLGCSFGARRAPLVVCADRLHVPELLARRARGLPVDPLDVDPPP
ncbi:hypothetical protein [Polyangium sp. 6x1]|uniref:WD40 repeat domain-containing protein n=1 Tax=Polyangium sp. 6x1 TaxID=3042689 RepID=UPI00248259B0|nr:hypothetical protein [Polyangium sp. 6x1]MDI1447536.1 hypothetical protein [Polyangium sp. 6x1]